MAHCNTIFNQMPKIIPRHCEALAKLPIDNNCHSEAKRKISYF